MTLALLLTAATGAWAQEETLLVTMTAGETVTYDPATATDVAEITMTGATQLGTWEDYYYGNHYSWLNSSWNDTDKGTLEVTAKPGYTITKVVFSGSDIAGGPGSREVTASPFAVYPWGGGSAFGSAVYTSDSYTEIIRNTASNDILGIDKIEVYGYAGTPVPGIKVTTNKAEGETTFTEAWFNMPAFDATVSYELVRDMGNQVELTVNGKQASAQNTPNIQVKKQGDAYPAASTLVVALTDLLEGKTAIESTNYTWALQRLAADGQTWQDLVVSNATLTPGAYNIVANAKDGTLYDGSINAKFNVIEGYQVTVAPGEYATLFVKEAVVVDEGSTDAVLYTISSVTDTEAVLSEAIKVAPAETPLLVYNKGEQDKTILLIPTTENADEVTPAKEFKGTLVEMEMPASSTRVDYYVCTGSAFMWVRDAGVIAANRCWLQIGEQPAASRAKTRSIVGGGDTTSLRGVNSEVVNSEDYYDLQGRKVAKPTRGGIYIHNGKKVIVR